MRCSLHQVGWGPSRSQVGVRLRFVRLVQALLSSPPSAGLLGFARRPPLFFSLAFSGFARSGPGVLVLVFSPSSLLLRSPLGVLVK